VSNPLITNYLIYSVEKQDFQAPVLKLKLQEKELFFDIANIAKVITDDLFITINKYFSKIDFETNQAIFDIFDRFHTLKSTNVDFTNPAIIEALEMDVMTLVDLIDLERFKNWLQWNNNDISFPLNIKEEFIFDPDLSVTREKTYTKKEYQDLVANILVIRMVVPVLTEYYNQINDTVKYSFYRVFLLTIRSKIYNSEEMEKLRTYIIEIQTSLNIQGTGKMDQYILLKGLSTDDINEFILADIIFTKLLFMDFLNNKSNIVSFIFQTIKYKTNSPATDADTIRSRTLKSDPKKEDQSYFEDYRKTSDVTLGTIAEIQHFLDNTQLIVSELKLASYYSLAEYTEELNYSFRLSKQKVTKIQIILLGWFMHKYINPRALFYIENKKVIELLTLANVVLWNAGHRFVALLLTSNIDDSSNYINSTVKYSFNKTDIAKLKTDYGMSISETKNILESSILEVVKEISAYIWTPNTTIEKRNAHNDANSIRNLNIPNNLISQLCDFIVFVNR
jgi:hypothetical protein